jgi:hypothetical protein
VATRLQQGTQAGVRPPFVCPLLQVGGHPQEGIKRSQGTGEEIEAEGGAGQLDVVAVAAEEAGVDKFSNRVDDRLSLDGILGVGGDHAGELALGESGRVNG